MAEAPGRRAWVIPLMGVAAGVGLSFLTVAIDRHYPSGLLPGSPISNAVDAQYILTTIAESVVPLTTTVLTVTLVAIQLAMGQFSPRIVRALLDDRSDQVAIAVFAATFAFALLSLRAVDPGRGTHVPSVTVLTALALAIASGVALFFFISHAGYRLRVAGLVDLVGDQLRSELAKRYPAQVPPSGQNDPSVVAADRSGNVIHVDEQALVARPAGNRLGRRRRAQRPVLHLRERDQPGRSYPFGGYGRSPLQSILSRCDVPAVTGRPHPGQHQRPGPQAVRRAGSSVRRFA